MLAHHLLLSHLDAQLGGLFTALLQQGFYVTLIGGAAREFIHGQVGAHDLDFELRHTADYHGAQWEQQWQLLHDFLQSRPQHIHGLQQLPFCVLRFKDPQNLWQIEFSSPRRENYQLSPQQVTQEGAGHSQFQATFSSLLPYPQAFARRDFTFNAIGIEFKSLNSWTIVDPLQGQADLAQGVLRACGENFFWDPVRFARGVRFSVQLGVSWEKTLLENLGKFNLRQLRPHYFFQEGLRAGRFFVYAARFFELCHQWNINLPDWLRPLQFLQQYGQKQQLVASRQQLLWYVYLWGAPKASAQILLENLLLDQKVARWLLQLQQLLQEICSPPWQEQMAVLAPKWQQLPWNDPQIYPVLEKLAQWHQLLKKRGEQFPFVQQEIQQRAPHLSAWQLGGELQGKAEFLAQGEIPLQQRLAVQIYCHLLHVTIRSS